MKMIEIQEKKSYTNNKMDEYASNGTYYFKNGFDRICFMKVHLNRLLSCNKIFN